MSYRQIVCIFFFSFKDSLVKFRLTSVCFEVKAGLELLILLSLPPKHYDTCTIIFISIQWFQGQILWKCLYCSNVYTLIFSNSQTFQKQMTRLSFLCQLMILCLTNTKFTYFHSSVSEHSITCLPT